MSKKWLKKCFFVVLLLVTMESPALTAFAEGGGEGEGTGETTPPPPPSCTRGENGETTTVVAATAASAFSTSDCLQALSFVGAVLGSCKIIDYYDQLHMRYVRPFCNCMQGVYSAGQNPFADPRHMYYGVERICAEYSLSEQNRKILRDFAHPIIAQFSQAMQVYGDLPIDFAFSPDTVRSLYLFGETGSGKSKLVMEELPKVFLKDPSSAIIVSSGKGFKEGEDVVRALFDIPTFRTRETYVSRARNVGELLVARAGRGIVVFDDYTKYSTPELDKLLFALHNEGKINTLQGEIYCPAVLFFYSSNEKAEEFSIFPEREVQQVLQRTRLSGMSEEEFIPRKITTRTIGHPEGFIRRVRAMQMTRLSGEMLRKALIEHFKKKIVPVVFNGGNVELDEAAISELVRLHESYRSGMEYTFDTTSLQSALLDFQMAYRGDLTRKELVMTYEDSQFKVKLRHPEVEMASRNIDSTRALPFLSKPKKCSTWNVRYGFTRALGRICRGLTACCCCSCCNPEGEEDFYGFPAAETEIGTAEEERTPFLYRRESRESARPVMTEEGVELPQEPSAMDVPLFPRVADLEYRSSLILPFDSSSSVKKVESEEEKQLPDEPAESSDSSSSETKKSDSES